MFPCVPYDIQNVSPAGETIVKAKQWAFGLRPIHLSRAFESGEVAERGKNGKQRDPDSTASTVKRDIAKKLISRLTVCELLYDPRVLLSGVSYHLANKAHKSTTGKKIRGALLFEEIRCRQQYCALLIVHPRESRHWLRLITIPRSSLAFSLSSVIAYSLR